MQLCLYLTPELVVSPLKESTKDGIMKELVTHLAQQMHIANSDALLKAVMDRERTSSTFLPSGVAIPHARVAEVNDIVVALGIAKDPVQDNPGQSSLSARIFCLFFSPTLDKEFGRHLKLLARISAVFCDTEFIEKIAAMNDSKQIFEALQKRERIIEEE